MITFDTDEHTIFEVRKHWFVLAAEITFGVIATLIPLIFYAIFSVLPITFETPGNGMVLFIFFYIMWLLGIWMVLFTLWTEFYLDVWIITNKRLIDIEQIGLFQREISTMQLSKIQDVTSEQHGMIATMLDYGDLHVQTAGSEKEFVIHHVITPNELRKKLDEVLQKLDN